MKFTYEDFNTMEAQKAARAAGNFGNDAKRVGFFKLAEGKEALVRFDVASLDQLDFATVHHPVFGQKWEGLSNAFTGISCLNNAVDRSGDCPLCKAVNEGHPVIGKAGKKVFVKMIVAYRNDDNTFAAPEAVVWERPSGFAKELAVKLQNYGDLTQQLFLVSRTGAGTDTRYSIDYAVPAVYKPSLVPADFSAFDGFQVNKHSYFEKTVDEINYYLENGTFEGASVIDTQVKANPAAQAAAPAKDVSVISDDDLPFDTPATAAPTPAPAPVVEEAKQAEKPVTKFGSFSF